MSVFDADHVADLLTARFRERAKGVPDMPGPTTRAEAYLVQDAMIAALGGACGFKVGRSKTDPEPYCAPLLRERRLANGGVYARRDGAALIEAELGFRLGRDVAADAAVGGRDECARLVDAVVPAIEILETRLAGPTAVDPLWKLADLQANGGVVLGEPAAWTGQDLGEACLSIGTEAGFETVLHPFGEPLDLFCWTVEHVARLRGGLRRGDVIITGSYCGIVELREPQCFTASFAGYGAVSVNIA